MNTIHKQIRVIVAEDDPVANRALVDCVCEAASMRLIESVTSCAAVQGLLVGAQADVLLLDLDLAGKDSTPLIGQAKASGLKVVIVSVLGDEHNVMRAIREGADGYLIKDSFALDAAQAVRDVVEDKPPLSPLVARYLLRTLQPQAEPSPEPAAPVLSPRELQMLKSLAAGYTYREIAQRYELSYHTVVDYMRSMYRKLDVGSRSEALIAALRQGLISVED